MAFEYGMRLRGFSIGCQPMNGLICRKDSYCKDYHDIIVYDRKLTDEEIRHYSLTFICEAFTYRNFTIERCPDNWVSIKKTNGTDIFVPNSITAEKPKGEYIHSDIIRMDSDADIMDYIDKTYFGN